jgi:hypothetical protein
MGFLDKAKATATAAMQQGQAKVEQIQQSRAEAELYKTLGEATYKARRQGGDQAAVDAALAALDNHFAQVAASGSDAAAGNASGSAEPTAPAGPASSGASSVPQSGNFTLDDM